MRSTERNNASMIGRVDAILSTFRIRRSLSVSEISRQAGLSKAATSRIVAELVDRRILERSGRELRLGIRLFELGEQATRPNDLRRLALVHMADLRTATRQTVHLAVLEGNEVVYIEILRSRTSPPLPSRVGGRLPAYATGVGKALLAHTPAEQLESLIPNPLASVGPRTVSDRALLLRQLAQIRASGVAYEREEAAPLLGCAASAIIGSDGLPIAALSVSVRLDLVDLGTIGPAVATSANAISREAVRYRFPQ